MGKSKCGKVFDDVVQIFKYADDRFDDAKTWIKIANAENIDILFYFYL